jgi:hypothetical protein
MEQDERRSGQGRREEDEWNRTHTLQIEGKLDRTDKVLKVAGGLVALLVAGVALLVLYLNGKYEPVGSVAALSKEQTSIYSALSKSQNEAKAAFDALAWKVDSLMQSRGGDAATITKLQDTLSTLNLTLAGLKAQLDQTSKNSDRIEDHEKRLGRLEAKAGVGP